MDVLNKLRLYGESLGLQGMDLQTFIKEQQAIQREDRKAERELEKQRLSAEEEREKVKLDLERERLWHEIEKMNATSDFELQQLELSSGGNRSDTGQGHVKPKTPKLPVFDDTKYEMDSYILRFERYAEAQN